jgi:hypothetical protein
MMRLRLSDLEAARQRPSDFRGGSPRALGWGPSTTRTLQYAVYEYHKQREDLGKAAQYFEDMYHKTFKRQHLLPDLLDCLIQYDIQFRSLSAVASQWNVRITVPIDARLELGGEIGRIDLAAGDGYGVWLLARTSRDWRSELRMPLIQGYFAERLGGASDRITVGFYFFDLGQHEATTFSASEIGGAFAEVRHLSSALSL